MIGPLSAYFPSTTPRHLLGWRALAPFTATFRHKHVDSLKHIMKYLSGTKNWGIMYTMSGDGLIGYTDADWANDCTNRQSILGYAFLYSGGVVSWMSRQQMSVADSSTHAEYIAAAEASKELVWLHRLLTELKEGVPGPTPLHIDNHTADLLAWNPVNHSAMKHIDVRYHFIRECIADYSIDLRLISMKDMAANILTKSLVHIKHEWFCLMLSMEMID